MKSEKDKYHLYVESKKIMHMKLLIYKTETDLQKIILQFPKREEGITWQYGINRYTLLYIK